MKRESRKAKIDLPMHGFNWSLGFLNNLKSKRKKSAKEICIQGSVMRVRSDTFGDPIFQKGLQN